VLRACQRRVEIVGLVKGFSSLFNPRVPHARLNPLFSPIPELDPAKGGSIIGSSRDYVNADDKITLAEVVGRLQRLHIEGLICVGGDGTLSGMQALSDYLPTVLAPKTIDNDLGLNYRHEPDEWVRDAKPDGAGHVYRRGAPRGQFDLEHMVNYVTPGFATAVFVSATGVERIRTTAESHRRIAIVEVMGRHSGYLALGAAYGQPDIVLIPEAPLNVERLVERVIEVYDVQKNAVIVCGEGIVDEKGEELGSETASTDPAGNKILSGASEALRNLLVQRLGDSYFTSKRRNESARAAVFTRKVGHTQRGGRPILFDRFHGNLLGGHAVDLLLEGHANGVAILQWNRQRGFYLDGVPGNDFRDRYGLIHPRQVHPSFYDRDRLRPSRTGIDYLLPIFNNAIGHDDMEAVRLSLFNPGNLSQTYHSVNVDIAKRICYLD
jgi:6-phosphofructokinase